MKFNLAQSDGYAITAAAPGKVRVNAEEWTQSLLLLPDAPPRAWAGVGDAQAWADVVAAAPSVVVIGTGESHAMLHPSTFRALIDARIGYEVMSTAAACRTYNVLLSEGRRVAVALVI